MKVTTGNSYGEKSPLFVPFSPTHKFCFHHKISNSHLFISWSIPLLWSSNSYLGWTSPNAFCFIFSPSYSKQFPMLSTCLTVCLTDSLWTDEAWWGREQNRTGKERGGGLSALSPRGKSLLNHAHVSSRSPVNLGREPDQLLTIPLEAQILLRSSGKEPGTYRVQLKGCQGNFCGIWFLW